MRWPRSILALLALAAPACQDTSLPRGAVVCEVERSSNACFRCQAQRCGAELDHCYGPGFHEGRSVGVPTTRRCVWNADTQKYDRDCSFSDGLGRGDASAAYSDPAYRNGRPFDGGVVGPPAAACGYQALCLQACGCGAECAASCRRVPDAGLTKYYSNDPRLDPGCSSCVDEYLAACVKRSCLLECGNGP